MSVLEIPRSTAARSIPTTAAVRVLAASAASGARALVVSDDTTRSGRALEALAVGGYSVVRGRFAEFAELAESHLPTVVLVDFASLGAGQVPSLIAALSGPAGACRRIGVVREISGFVRAAASSAFGIDRLISIRASEADLLAVVAATQRDVVGRSHDMRDPITRLGDGDV